MNALELLTALYGWADARALPLLGGAVLVPLLTVGVAWLGRNSPSRFGERIANGLTLAAVALFLMVLLLGLLGLWAFDASLWKANLLLLLAPPAFLGTSFAAVHQVFPLNRLASVRTLREIGLFLGACLLVAWLLSQFRGWGIIFFGGTLQLLLVGAALWWLLRQLWRRAKGKG